jgi:hypothetical protein
VATGEEIARLAAVVGRDFEPFRRYCEREALYIVAICQSESKARRAEWEAEQEGAAESDSGQEGEELHFQSGWRMGGGGIPARTHG